MTFDNILAPATTTAAILRERLPVALLTTGVAALAVSIHLTFIALLLVAMTLLALGGSLLLLQRRAANRTSQDR